MGAGHFLGTDSKVLPKQPLWSPVWSEFENHSNMQKRPTSGRESGVGTELATGDKGGWLLLKEEQLEGYHTQAWCIRKTTWDFTWRMTAIKL